MAPIKIISDNRKAFHEYTISDRYEAGIALTGTEVKACRAGKVNLTDGWVDLAEGDAILRDAHISKYSHGTYANHDEKRPRRLLLKKSEIIKLCQRVEQKGYTVIPLKIYFKGQYIKVELGVAKGKQLHDKRAATREREDKLTIERAMRARRG